MAERRAARFAAGDLALCTCVVPYSRTWKMVLGCATVYSNGRHGPTTYGIRGKPILIFHAQPSASSARARMRSGPGAGSWTCARAARNASRGG